jgi:Tfp pilus assembly protein PilN
MIKVNLLRNRVQESTSADPGPGRSGDQLREAVIKIAVILIFVVGLILYESQNLRAMNDELARSKAEAAKLTADNTARAAEAEKVKDLEVQARELEDKLKILKLLSKLRLREVKTLDFLQSSIPEKVWLKTISYESDKIHVEAGHFQISGNAAATEELTEFVRRLEDSTYLMDVIVVKNLEQNISKSNSIRDFLFTAEVENKN